MKRTATGFTLTELITVVAILAVIAAIAVPSYHYYTQKARLEKARGLLVENVHFMEQYYARHHDFKATANTWPDLPHTATTHFDIAFTSAAKGEPAGRYRLRAKPNSAYENTEKRYLEIDHHGNVELCHKEENLTRCQKY